MLIVLPDILDPAGVAQVRRVIDGAPWADGNATSGPQAALAKRNEQLPEDSGAAVEAGRMGYLAGRMQRRRLPAARKVSMFLASPP